MLTQISNTGYCPHRRAHAPIGPELRRDCRQARPYPLSRLRIRHRRLRHVTGPCPSRRYHNVSQHRCPSHCPAHQTHHLLRPTLTVPPPQPCAAAAHARRPALRPRLPLRLPDRAQLRPATRDCACEIAVTAPAEQTYPASYLPHGCLHPSEIVLASHLWPCPRRRRHTRQLRLRL